MLQHGHSTCEMSNLLGISQSTCFRIHIECDPHVEPSILVRWLCLMLGERRGISITSSHVSQTIKHGGGGIFVCGCVTSCGMGYICKIKGR